MKIVISIIHPASSHRDSLRICSEGCEYIVHRGEEAYAVASGLLEGWESVEVNDTHINIPQITKLFDPNIRHIERELKDMIKGGANNEQIIEWSKSYSFGMNELLEIVRRLLSRTT